MVITWFDSFVQKCLLALKTGAAVPNLGGGKIDLYQNNYLPLRSDGSSQYTIATFSGYAQITLACTGPYPDTVLGPYLQTQLCVFEVASSPTVGNTVYGFYVSDAAGDPACAAQFDIAVPMNAPLAVCSFAAQLRIRDYSF